MIPGLSIKRWLAIGAIGFFVLTLGVIFTLKISTGPASISFLESVSLRHQSPYLRGGLFIGLGALGALIAGLGLTRSLSQIGNKKSSHHRWSRLQQESHYWKQPPK